MHASIPELGIWWNLKSFPCFKKLFQEVSISCEDSNSALKSTVIRHLATGLILCELGRLQDYRVIHTRWRHLLSGGQKLQTSYYNANQSPRFKISLFLREI